jgi:tRNA threonylcarbamoyl adenosine modification protein (Sua5/YciO/YrdC/YwlC family)
MFGLGCSVFDRQAIARINKLKRRTSSKGYIMLFAEIDWLERYAIVISEKMHRLLQKYWPGNLTAVLPDEKNNFPLISQDQHVAVRVPGDQFLRDYIKQLDVPIISTSINISGNSPENNLNAIRQNFRDWYELEIILSQTKMNLSQASTIIKENNNELQLMREGSIEFSEIRDSWQNPKILFVCTANICRSPMAEYYFNRKAEQIQLSSKAHSAGFLSGGYNISENSKRVLAENDIRAGSHLSTQLGEDVIRKSWLILTMTKKHKSMLINNFPAAARKTFTLSEYAGFKNDIADPYGLDIEFYRNAYLEIKSRIDVIVEKISKEGL